MSSFIEIRELTKTYGAKTAAVNNLNLTLERGKIIGLLGPNGSGKSTLIKMMNGLLIPTHGKILIDGREPGTETKALVSYLPERTYLDNSSTANTLIDFFSDFYSDFFP